MGFTPTHYNDFVNPLTDLFYVNISSLGPLINVNTSGLTYYKVDIIYYILFYYLTF